MPEPEAGAALGLGRRLPRVATEMALHVLAPALSVIKLVSSLNRSRNPADPPLLPPHPAGETYHPARINPFDRKSRLPIPLSRGTGEARFD